MPTASPSRSSNSRPTLRRKKIRSMEDAGKIDAILRAQAVIEFKMDGTILTANENFLKAMGYSLAEIQGKHHSMFVEPAMRDSAEYREFWAKLNRGEYSAAEYKRIGKGGKEVWILASYNPDSRRTEQAVQGRQVCDRRHRAEAEHRQSCGPDCRDRKIAGRDRIQHGRHDHHRQRKFPGRLGICAGGSPRQASRHVRRTVRARQRRIS